MTTRHRISSVLQCRDDDNVEPQHPVLGDTATDRPSDDGSDGSGFDSLVEEGESSDSEQEGNESSHCDEVKPKFRQPDFSEAIDWTA